MSKDYQLNWPAHPNIYNHYSPRELNIYFSEPDQGVNKDTGLILLIPGFGGNPKSNVYKKMRSKFADEYNLITVQCDYFGQEFMQGSQNVAYNLSKKSLESIFSREELAKVYHPEFDPEKFLKIGSRYPINVRVKEILHESINNFNDMGILQAIDNITALTYVIQVLKDNGLTFNTRKIILFGQSQGAYLSYLCNAFAPTLFTLLIDNSSWLFPAYLRSSRYLFTKVGNMTLQTEFSYFASKRTHDEELLYLPSLYRHMQNNCEIICFHGTTDQLIPYTEKRDFCNQIEHCIYHEIGSDKVDGDIFKSTSHGLDANFLKLFDYVYKNVDFSYGKDINLGPVTFETSEATYDVTYETGIPVLNIKSKVR
jgi:hypothetical protein